MGNPRVVLRRAGRRWCLAGLCFLFIPQIRRLPDDLLALWVEAKCPRFDHRLISAVQLNRPKAKLDGMSPELVAVVTREAEKESKRLSFASLADHGRLTWAAIVAVPALLLIAIPFAVWPRLGAALLARQALLDIEVPHSVELQNASKPVWPIGDTISIQYRVKGKWTEDMEGVVTVTPLGGRPDRYPLKFIKQDGADAIFGADDVKPSSVNLLHSARLADGRTVQKSEMKLVPRPVVDANEAWLLLPEFCGTRPTAAVTKSNSRAAMSSASPARRCASSSKSPIPSMKPGSNCAAPKKSCPEPMATRRPSPRFPGASRSRWTSNRAASAKSTTRTAQEKNRVLHRPQDLRLDRGLERLSPDRQG